MALLLILFESGGKDKMDENTKELYVDIIVIAKEFEIYNTGKVPRYYQVQNYNELNTLDWTMEQPAVSSKQLMSSNDIPKTESPNVPSAKIMKPSKQKIDSNDAEGIPDDHFLYCTDCQRNYHGDCPIHGSFIIAVDNEVPADGSDLLRAFHTLPNFLSIEASSIPGAGCGVWSKVEIPKGVRFGPYEGLIIYDAKRAHQSGYCWQIKINGRVHHYVDAKDKSYANWLRFVNCACYEQQQNLLAFQYYGQIYYRTFKPVPPWTELLVYYGDEYATELGIGWNRSGSGNWWSNNRRFLNNENNEPNCSRSLNYIFPKKLSVHSVRKSYNKLYYYSDQKRNNYTNITELQRHMSISKFKNPYLCNFCGRIFATRLTFGFHYRSHLTEMYFRCDFCENTFTRKNLLLKHQKLNKCSLSYTCKTSRESGNLEEHMKSHAKGTCFQCDVCNKQFASKASLQSHIRIHTGERPFPCEFCNKSFIQSGHLQSHRRIHTGEMPFSCDICGMKFRHPNVLKSHKIKNHNNI